MTEHKWLASDDPIPMLEQHADGASARKLRLFGCAACRSVWVWIDDPRCRAAVEAAEEFADGLISEAQLAAAYEAADDAHYDAASSDDRRRYAARAASYLTSLALPPSDIIDAIYDVAEFARRYTTKERAAQAALLRDVLGNPFREIAFSPAWRTDTVIALARTMYEAREFSAMPILADALQDAGCDNEEILNHCRDRKQVHVRGCWVLDLILGKS